MYVCIINIWGLIIYTFLFKPLIFYKINIVCVCNRYSLIFFEDFMLHLCIYEDSMLYILCIY